MMEYKILLGIFTILLGVLSYFFYIRDIVTHKTKPDAYSWGIWGVLASIIFFAQYENSGGPGSWVTAFTAMVCFIIAALSYSRGYGRIKAIDVISLIGAALGVVVWFFTKDPLLAVLLTIVVGIMGFVPVFRKAYDTPKEETAITYLLNGLKFAVALLALESFTPVTWLYPVALTVLNLSLAGMLFLRQRS